MPHSTAQPEHQEAAVRDSASEQPEALIKSKHKLKALMADSISTVQVHGLTAVSGRRAVKGDLAVESFKCQLWKPASSVPELEPGEYQALLLCLCQQVTVPSPSSAHCQTACSATVPPFCVHELHCFCFYLWLGPDMRLATITVRSGSIDATLQCCSKHCCIAWSYFPHAA